MKVLFTALLLTACGTEYKNERTQDEPYILYHKIGDQWHAIPKTMTKAECESFNTIYGIEIRLPEPTKCVKESDVRHSMDQSL